MIRILIILTAFIIAEGKADPTAMSDYKHIQQYLIQKRHVIRRRYRPIFHVSAPVGWMNDPCGIVYYQNRYHLFYQYNPYNSFWGPTHWGHVVSSNLVDWIYYPPALVPTEKYEKHGCLAGTAFVHNNYMNLIYTGNIFIKNMTYQTQNIASSADGLVFQKYHKNPIIKPDDQTIYFKNPKVWRYNGKFYMLIGSSTPDGRGSLILQTSNDLFNWHMDSTLAESLGDMGEVWENPDFFDLDGHQVLILSVRGIQPYGYRYRNLYQTGYVVTRLNYKESQFEDTEISTATFNELDQGHDFYAAQTQEAGDGRRLLIAWLGMCESEFREAKDGWAGMMTIVRELRLSVDGKILMNPAKEMVDLRREIMENAWYTPGEVFFAGAKSFELLVNATSAMSDVSISFEWDGYVQYSVSYFAEKEVISVDRGGVDGVRRAAWFPTHNVYWRMFVDSSSVEVFCGAGEIVFSTRIYPKKSMKIHVGGNAHLHLVQYRLRRSVGYDSQLYEFLKNTASSVKNEKY